MASEAHKQTLSEIFPMIVSRLKMAHGIASAAGVCTESGNHDGAFRILLDVEELMTDAITLLNAASLIRREQED